MIREGSVCAVITAAGSSQRMQEDKLMLPICGKPVIRWCVEAFETCEDVEAYVLVARDVDKARGLLLRWGAKKCIDVVMGGNTRSQSVYNGICAVPADFQTIAIHDGARCFVTHSVIRRTIRAARAQGSGVAGIPCTDTVKRVNADGRIVETPDRDALRMIQTPQTFSADLIRRAYTAAINNHIEATDDAAIVELTGHAVFVVAGDHENIKMTVPEDVAIGERILRRRMHINESMRVGLGYDVHCLVQGRKLILGGVEIPHELGLLGHSDADVLTHAVMDGLLGAAAMGDIGRHFPDTDEAYAGADSIALLGQVCDMLKARGWKIVNIDATVAAQRPKLAGHINAMRECLARAMHIDTDQVSIKATTTEGLGFEGREEGISAQVAVLIKGFALPA